MDTEALIRQGLTSDPKYLPVWYRYDKDGSFYNDKCLTENKFYYFYKSEMSVLREHIQDIVPDVIDNVVLVDMGSGNCEKTHGFIDTLLERQETLQYIPVDISKEFLAETADQLSKKYNDRLLINPVPGNYDIAISKLRDIPNQKIIIWLGGGFQNQSYTDQVRRLENLSKVMTERCRLIISLDITCNKEQIEKAYLDPTGISEKLYLNAMWRLNREYGSNIDTNKLSLASEYVHREDPMAASYVMCYCKVLEDQVIDIPGLGISITLKTNDKFFFHEGDGVSHKYSIEQIKSLAACSGQLLVKHWSDTDSHVAVSCFCIRPNKEVESKDNSKCSLK